MRSALFGRKTEFRATFADIGRRLPYDITVSTNSNARSIEFTGFDAVGREVSRKESSPFGGEQFLSYDPLGRLATSQKVSGGVTRSQWSFRYDPLGNIQDLNDEVGANSALASYQGTDRDRICAISYDRSSPPGPACNVQYDALGDVTYEPTRSGYNRLAFFNSGGVRSIRDAFGNELAYRYDPFGSVQEMDLKSGQTLVQADRHYGQFISKRFLNGQRLSKGPDKSTFITRQFPGPGLVISRRGAKGPWVFQFTEPRGTRFTTDEDGNFLQDLDYSPFGAASSNGVSATDASFTSSQWNQGEALSEFGLVQLGARVYDPALGRFLSRDPAFIVRGSSASNPYSFAADDPINFSDPDGRDLCDAIPGCSGQGDSRPLWGALITGGWNSVTDRVFPRAQPSQPSQLPKQTPNSFPPEIAPIEDVLGGWADNTNEQLGGIRSLPIAIPTQLISIAKLLGKLGGPIAAQARSGQLDDPIGTWLTLEQEGGSDGLQYHVNGLRDGDSGRRTVFHVLAITTFFVGVVISSGGGGVSRPGGLRPVGNGVWESPAGLRYGGGSMQGNRVLHVMEHAVDNPTRAVHGVFDGGRTSVIATIDEAYVRARAGGPGVTVTQQGNLTVYYVDMGRRVGFVGGIQGAATGFPAASHVRLVLDGSNVITAFPQRIP